ncbi:MAG: hypothetical protein DAHOPDDO_01693 [Ignavibacteriaceae bacterium]|nr:hypothetical protein [Ignavibacteriaceae bacterium]
MFGTIFILYNRNSLKIRTAKLKMKKLYLLIITLPIFLFGRLYGQSLSAEQIYEKVNDAVVVIYAYGYSEEPEAQGSGVVLNDKGYIVTNYHVLSGCERLEILHRDEVVPYVDIIGIDVEKDILILKIEENKFPFVKIGEVKSLKVGQRVYAIGSPLGFENSISEGIISGLRNYEELGNYIQITASISSGSSGGAVVNDRGELIGISTLSADEGQNLNFAIPIDEVLSVEINSYSKNKKFKDFELLKKGWDAFQMGDYLNCVAYYTRYIEKYPNEYGAYLNRGVAWINLNNYAGAIKDFNKVIDINPNLDVIAGAYNSRAIAKGYLTDHIGALQDFDIAIELDPSYVGAYINRGDANFELGNYNESIQDYSNAIVLNPTDYSDAYYKRGKAKNSSNDYTGAIQDYNKAIELNPILVDAYINRGISKYNLGDRLGACLDWSKAGELGSIDAYKFIKEYCD